MEFKICQRAAGKHLQPSAPKWFQQYSLTNFNQYNILGLPLTQYCAGDKIEKNEMGWACGAYG